jgi:hypothetical protein
MKKKELNERPEVKMKLDSILEDYIYFFNTKYHTS